MAGGWTTPELVSAVSNAGGFGSLAGAGVPPERLREDIRAVKEQTDRPFAVNFLLAPPGPGSRDVAAAQRFLDGFRERFGLPSGETDLVAQPPPLEEQLEVVFEEGVRVANGIRYGLSSAIFTRDVNRAFRAMRDLQAGITYINAGTTGAEVHLPFGGTKDTGNGHREAGQAALDVFTEWKSIYVDYSGRLQRAQIDNVDQPAP